MTETTDSRQIRIMVQGILFKYGIDDLGLEANLSSAFLRYMQERRKSKDKTSIRKNILADMQVYAAKQSKNEEIESRVFRAMGLYVNDRWYTDGVITFLQEKDEQGQTIEAFAQACKDNPYEMPKFFKIAEKPSYLKDVWGLAFQGDKSGYNPQGLSVTA